TGFPSRSIMQAPHSESSQPSLAPVRPTTSPTAARRLVPGSDAPGEGHAVADGRQEARPGLELDGVGHAVDGERRLDPHGRAPLAGIGTAVPRARATAISTARRAITSAIARR